MTTDVSRAGQSRESNAAPPRSVPSCQPPPSHVWFLMIPARVLRCVGSGLGVAGQAPRVGMEAHAPADDELLERVRLAILATDDQQLILDVLEGARHGSPRDVVGGPGRVQ